MPSNQQVNLGVGFFVVIGGACYAIRKMVNRSRINQRQAVFNQAMKCNLNQLSITRQMGLVVNKDNHFMGQNVAIQNVMAHFTDKVRPFVHIKGNKYDDFPRVSCSQFNIVERTYNKDSFTLYAVDFKDTLTSKNVLIPDITFRDPKNSRSSNYLRMLTSASTLGIIGTFGISSDGNSYKIDAKMIGCSLQQIRKFIDQERFYNNFGLFLGGVFVILGSGWMYKTLQSMDKNRAPLQMSLLTTSSHNK